MVLFFDQARRAPWVGRKPIYAHIQRQIAEQGMPIDGALPDDEQFWGEGQLRWVAGGLDGAMGHHAAPGELTDEMRELVGLLAKQTRRPTAAMRRTTYRKLLETNLGGVMDDVLEEVVKHPGILAGPLFEEAQWFAEHAADRNVVKFGIALLGLYRNENVRDLLLTLGSHDEFTLYAAVALQNGADDGNEALFQLARRVNGWGKIHLVERLAPSTPKMRDWLLREGCANSIMNEYLAHVCAVKGELHLALAAGTVDGELFEGASVIVQALLSGGPAEDIEGYDHAPQVITDYLRHAGTMCASAMQLSVVLDIRTFLDPADEKWEARLASGWTEAGRAACIQACEALLAEPKWTRVVMEAVSPPGSGSVDQSDSRKGSARVEHFYGVACARKLGLDVWEQLFGQLAAEPLDSSLYYDLMRTDDGDRVRRVVDFAEAHLPLREIAAGPANEMGFGPGVKPHMCLDMIVQSLGAFEGVGLKLLAAALMSPVVRNRSMAIRVLEEWDLRSWGPEISRVLTQLSGLEPDVMLQDAIGKLREVKGI
ncbi:limonene hydroxylase [Paenibacillus aurantiacus]|uniref:Limonene hydroxylase n=1 Tax=Paenibacillus aurantiacus TaxID=1936118 RepID=A0ABV5KJI9_9BACL